jgi:agmatine deiminase
MHRYLFPPLLSLLVGCVSPESAPRYHLPAEWEPHRAVIVEFDNDPWLDSVSTEVVYHISQETSVYCLILDESLRDGYLRSFRGRGVNLSRVRFVIYPGDIAFSARDYFFFLKDRRGDLAITDFHWVEYGYHFDSTFRATRLAANVEARSRAESLYTQVFKSPLVESDLALEGGAIEVNGRGTVILAEAVNMHRNPGWTKAQQEEELRRVLGVRHFLWMKDGPADDPHPLGTAVRLTDNYFGNGVGGHVDEFVRFVDSTTVFLCWPESLEAAADPVKRITRDRMMVNRRILEGSTDQDGKTLRIVEIPVPDDTYLTIALDTGSVSDLVRSRSREILVTSDGFALGDTVHIVPAASYLNFLVTNGIVLVPAYWRPGLPESGRKKDEVMSRICEAHFPGRRVVQINPRAFNFTGGGIHCWTMQVPR